MTFTAFLIYVILNTTFRQTRLPVCQTFFNYMVVGDEIKYCKYFINNLY